MAAMYEDDIDVTPIVVDIETCGLPNAADYLEPVTPDGRLTDPAKIAADIKAKELARLERLALDWNVGRIAAIGWWTEEDGITVRLCHTEGDEADALTEFWREARRRTLVGFNCKSFDLRFLIQRSRYLGVSYPLVDVGKYSRKGVIDLFSELTFNDGVQSNGCMRVSLKAFCKRFGIPVNDTIDGKDVPALVSAGEWEQVEAHVKSDVESTVLLAQRLQVIRCAVPVRA